MEGSRISLTALVAGLLLVLVAGGARAGVVLRDSLLARRADDVAVLVLARDARHEDTLIDAGRSPSSKSPVESVRRASPGQWPVLLPGLAVHGSDAPFAARVAAPGAAASGSSRELSAMRLARGPPRPHPSAV